MTVTVDNEDDAWIIDAVASPVKIPNTPTEEVRYATGKKWVIGLVADPGEQFEPLLAGSLRAGRRKQIGQVNFRDWPVNRPTI